MAVIGYSMGAVPVSKTISIDKGIKTAIFISPATNFKKFIASSSKRKYLNRFLCIGKGKLTGLNRKDLLNDLHWVYKNSNPLDLIKKSSIPILTIVGSKDDTTPPKSCKLLFEKTNEPKEYREIEGADHMFSRRRYPLIDNILEWLKRFL